jgi:aminocarboxymuconate-semialdehyde decarboxylase
VIDTHAHLFLDELLDLVPGMGPSVDSSGGSPSLVIGGYRWPLTSAKVGVDPGQRLDELDEAGIKIQLVSLSPLWLFPHIDAATAVAFHRRANVALARWAGRDRERLRPIASLPTQNIAAAVAELTRAHDAGFAGGYFSTSARQGLDDAELDDLYAAAVQLDLPLFVHSTMPGLDAPGDPRLERWMGGVVLGYPFEETYGVMSLLFGGVYDRHPELDVVVSHGGGTFALLHGRMREYSALGRSPIDVSAFDSAVARLWVDTHVHSLEGLAALRRIVHPDRLVFGSNFGGWDSAGQDELASFGDELDSNARRLLRLPTH